MPAGHAENAHLQRNLANVSPRSDPRPDRSIGPLQSNRSRWTPRFHDRRNPRYWNNKHSDWTASLPWIDYRNRRVIDSTGMIGFEGSSTRNLELSFDRLFNASLDDELAALNRSVNLCRVKIAISEALRNSYRTFKSPMVAVGDLLRDGSILEQHASSEKR